MKKLIKNYWLSFAVIVVLILKIVQLGMINEPHEWMMKILPVALSALTVVMGTALRNVKTNFVVGIRVPWTLASEENWKHTHRFAGRCYVALGLASLAVSLLYPIVLVAIMALLISSIAGVGYSIYYYRIVELKKISL